MEEQKENITDTYANNSEAKVFSVDYTNSEAVIGEHAQEERSKHISTLKLIFLFSAFFLSLGLLLLALSAVTGEAGAIGIALPAIILLLSGVGYLIIALFFTVFKVKILENQSTLFRVLLIWFAMGPIANLIGELILGNVLRNIN